MRSLERILFFLLHFAAVISKCDVVFNGPTCQRCNVEPALELAGHYSTIFFERPTAAFVYQRFSPIRPDFVVCQNGPGELFQWTVLRSAQQPGIWQRPLFRRHPTKAADGSRTMLRELRRNRLVRTHSVAISPPAFLRPSLNERTRQRISRSGPFSCIWRNYQLPPPSPRQLTPSPA